ncbi:CHST9 [Mytilus coruscus]|uniref:Carbohydrate sulfotransferase n=1 Tax=Mytilus coruscus TaxID=42192 RepID=A0A6J8AB74_MYTCO|nr:CHST9 [Mytilus coruscus]
MGRHMKNIICILASFLAIILWLKSYYSVNADSFSLILRKSENKSRGKRINCSSIDKLCIIKASNKSMDNHILEVWEENVAQLTHDVLSNPNTKNYSTSQKKDVPWLSDKDLKQIKRSSYTSPIVVTKYKLIFFWNEKSGCTYWKKLLQVIQGLKNKEVHHPDFNGLTYLITFKDNEITEMMFDDSWTKAVFVREPRERILSSYLEKGLDNFHMMNNCNRTVKSFIEFLNLGKTCKDPHWASQVRVPKYFYKNMMIGKMPDILTFTEKLLVKIGAWNESVKVWIYSKDRKKKTRYHAKKAIDKLSQYYNDTKIQDMIFERYADDYEVFNFEKKYFGFDKNLQKH